jgi:hypothetical protein
MHSIGQYTAQLYTVRRPGKTRVALEKPCMTRVRDLLLDSQMTSNDRTVNLEAFEIRCPFRHCAVAPYLYYRCTLMIPFSRTIFVLIVSREDSSRPPGSAARTPLRISYFSLFLRQVDLASARESLCRGLGSRWFMEWFHRNALVTHIQHGQVFSAARQLKDYAVARFRFHQRARQR